MNLTPCPRRPVVASDSRTPFRGLSNQAQPGMTEGNPALRGVERGKTEPRNGVDSSEVRGDVKTSSSGFVKHLIDNLWMHPSSRVYFSCGDG